ncbi:MAG: MATE family efflux transporter [Candidatus Limivicinus sp.]
MNCSENILGTEKIWKLLLRMGLPGLAAQLINLLYNLVDRIYIGHIPEMGSVALSGVGLTMPILEIISAFSALVGNGGAPLASIAMGMGDKERAERILGNGTVLLLFLSAVLTALFMAIRRPFLYMVGASDASYPYAEQYIVIYLTGTVFVQLSLGLNPFISAQGQAKTAMLSTVIGAVINIILDPIFIFALNMGVRGAALATVISQFASALWIVIYLTRPGTSLHIRRSCLKPERKIIKSILALGVSPFTMSATNSLIVVVLSRELSIYGGAAGDLHVAALAILQSVMQLIFIPLHGFTGGAAPIISYNYGAGKSGRVRETVKKMLAAGVGYSFLISLLAVLFPEMFGRMFSSNEELIALVKRVLPIFIMGMFIFGAQCVCQTVFTSTGQAGRSMLVAMLRKVILLAPLAVIFPAVSGNVMSIYWAEPVSDIISVTACLLIFADFVRKSGFRMPDLR